MDTAIKYCLVLFVLIACILLFRQLTTPVTPIIPNPDPPFFPVNFPEWTRGPGIDQFAVAAQRIKDWRPYLDLFVIKCMVDEISKVCPFEYFVSTDETYFNEAMTYVIQYTSCLEKWTDGLITHLYSIIPTGCKKDLAVKEIVKKLTPAQFILSDNQSALIAPIIKNTCVF
jgi:hypothetical protein